MTGARPRNLATPPAHPAAPAWVAAVHATRGPRYLAIAHAIRDALVSGQLKTGDRLPPQRELARQLDVNLGTVTRAADALRSMGLVQGEVGRGTFLTAPAKADAPASLWDHTHPLDYIDLSHNFPEHAPSLAGAHALLTPPGRDDLQSLLAVQVDAGYAAHRAAAASWMQRRGIPATANEVIVTCGAQHGLLMALGALTRPGEIVLTEELTYYGLKSAASMLGRPIVGVRMDAQGLLPEALDLAAQRSGAKVVFCCPTLHNPTTATMGRERRLALVEICRRRDLLIVEDDVYGMLPHEHLPTLASLAPERTVHVTGLSKLAGPGLRVGYIAAPLEHTRALGVALRATTLMAPPMSAATALGVLEPENMARIVHAIQQETAARLQIVAAHLPASAVVARQGAFYFGLRVGAAWSAGAFAQAADSLGIGVTPYDVFEGTPMVGGGLVRVCHNAAPDHATLQRALVGLRQLLETRPL